MKEVNINMKCACGKPLKVIYNTDGIPKERRCTDDKCPERIIVQVQSFQKKVNLPNINRNDISSLVSRGETTVSIIAGQLKKSNIKISLADFARLHYIRGFDKAWDSYVNNINTPEELINKISSSKKPEEAYLRLNEIKENVKLFNFSLPKVYTGRRLRVMLTGTPPNLPELGLSTGMTKPIYLSLVNGILENSYVLVESGKRKTGISLCIRGEDATNTGKVRAATQAGVPVVTYREFLDVALEYETKGEDLFDNNGIYRRLKS